jgi:MoxR-like ATPase
VPEVTEQGIATKSALRLGVVCRWLLGPYEKKDAKQVLFLDEFNYAQPQVLTLLNSLCDFRDSIHVPELVGNTDLDEPNLDTEGNIKRIKGKHLLIIAMNPAEKAQYVGTIGMNIAQLRRFESVEIKYLNWDSERQAIITALPEIDNQSDLVEVKNLMAIAAQSRKKYTNGEIGNPITTANIINYLRMYKDKTKAMQRDDIRDTILSMYKESEQDAIKAIFGYADKNKDKEKGGAETE